MADPPRNADPKPHTRPRWVKVLGIIILVAVLLVVVMMIAGGGQHGPSRHTQPFKVPEHGMQQS